MSQQPNNQQPINQAPTTLEGQCNSCGTLLVVPFPPIVCVHHPVLDTLTIPHTKGIHCPKCGTHHSIVMISYQVSLTLIKEDKIPLNEDNLIQPVTTPFKLVT